MRTVDFEPQVFSYFVQGLTDRSNREAGTSGHAPRYGCRLNDDCWRFRVAIARGSLRVIDDAEGPCDNVRCNILQNEP